MVTGRPLTSGTLALLTLLAATLAHADPARIVVPAPASNRVGLPLPPLLGAPVLRPRTIAEDIRESRDRRQVLDGTAIDPMVPSPVPRRAGANPARAGRPDLDRLRAGDFARSGPTAIGASPVTRPATGTRR